MRIINNKIVPLLGLSLLLFLPSATLVAAELNLQLPPQSIAQWYKPQNKRQVWLHTMFQLRRSMQALQEYVERNDGEALAKWGESFDSSYRKVGEMVPQWRDELELEWSARLRDAAVAGDVAGVERALGKVAVSCRSCHNEYQTVTSILYRTPDFAALKLSDGAGGEIDYRQLMHEMSRSVNQVKIFYEDGQRQAASEAAVRLQRLTRISAESCAQCHKQEASISRIYSAESDGYQRALQAGIAAGDAKQVNGNLGKIGAFVCARCHAVHKPLAELRAMMLKRQ